MKPLCISFLFLVVAVWGQETSLTLKKIHPCSGPMMETVSRYKTDVYAVNSSFQECNPPKANITSLRIITWTRNTINESVVFLSRQGTSDATTWPIPFEPQGFTKSYYSVNRTMCPFNITEKDNPSQILLYVDVFSSSQEEVEYGIQVDLVEIFVLEIGDEITVTVGASSPQVLYFKFPDNIDQVSVEALADNEACVYFSVQQNDCPINDILRTAASRGLYQSMSKVGYIKVRADQMTNREFVVVLVSANNSLCNNGKNDDQLEVKSGIYDEFYQNIVVTVHQVNSNGYTFIATFFVLLIMSGILLPLGLPKIWICSKRCKDCCCASTNGTNSESARRQGYGSVQNQNTDDEITALNQFYGEEPDALKNSYWQYCGFTVIVGIFYAIPAVQLLASQIMRMNDVGEQDMCYFNFKCAYQINSIYALNSIISNIGYIIFGILFFIIVFIRHCYSMKQDDDDENGIPKFFGLFYAMSFALIMEGIMSAMYHICPTNTNFQYDTAFMFVIGGLLLAQLFQKRHPDFYAKAFVSFFFLSGVVLVTLFGIIIQDSNNNGAKGFIVVMDLIGMFIFLLFVYYPYFKEEKKEYWDDKDYSERIENICSLEFIKSMLWKKPKRTIGFILLLLNGLHTRYRRYCYGQAMLPLIGLIGFDTATVVLAIIVWNVCSFLFLYVIKKLCNKECGTIGCWTFICLAIVFWAIAVSFFRGGKETNSNKTPAESRNMNKECQISVYDYHDLWHIMSAFSLFFTFCIWLTVDDDVEDTATEELKVF